MEVTNNQNQQNNQQDKEQDKKKNKTVIMWLLSFSFVVLCISIGVAIEVGIINQHNTSFRNIQNTQETQEEKVQDHTEIPTLNFTPVGKKDLSKAITIPAVTGIDMTAHQLKQRVLFENPKTNNCLFRIRLYLSDNTLLWKSDYIEPNTKVVEEDVLFNLERGVYKNCRIYYDCYTLDKLHQLNGAMFEIEINVQ